MSSQKERDLLQGINPDAPPPLGYISPDAADEIKSRRSASVYVSATESHADNCTVPIYLADREMTARLKLWRRLSLERSKENNALREQIKALEDKAGRDFDYYDDEHEPTVMCGSCKHGQFARDSDGEPEPEIAGCCLAVSSMIEEIGRTEWPYPCLTRTRPDEGMVAPETDASRCPMYQAIKP